MDSLQIFNLVLEQSRVGFWDWDLLKNIGTINNSFRGILGYQKDELSDEDYIVRLPTIINEEDYSKSLAMMNSHIESKGNIPFDIEVRYTHKTGATIWVHSRASVIKWDDEGSALNIVGSIVDITAMKEKEEQLIHTNNLNKILSLINSYLLNTDTKQDMYDEVCNIINIAGGIKLVWIGEVTDNYVKPAAMAGSPLSYLKNITISIDDSTTSKGPTARAINEKQRYICNDFLADPNTSPWHAVAKAAGLKSSATFPIKINNKVYSVLNVYAAYTNYFTDKEIALFEEIVSTINYGIERIRLTNQKNKSDNRIKLLADIIEKSPALIAIAKISDNTFIYMNNAFKEALELAPDEDITKISVLDIRPSNYYDFIGFNVIGEIRAKGKWKGYNQIISRSGKIIPLYQTINLYDDGSANKALFMTSNAINISELKEKETELRELTNHLFNVREEERRSIAKEIHDELGQNLTGMNLGISWLEKHIEDDKETLLSKLHELDNIIRDTITSTRGLYNSLYPQMLEDVGLLGAIRWHSSTYLSSNNIKVVLRSNLKEDKPIFTNIPNACLSVYRVYQECTTNILRYAKAKKVTIYLNVEDGHLHLMIKDNGIGFEIDKVDTKLHHGLLGMRERISLLDGTIIQESVPGLGTTNIVKVPLVQKEKSNL